MYKKVSGSAVEFLVLYVDDILLIGTLQEKTKIVTEISVTISSQFMVSDGFVTEFSPSQYWSSLNFATEFFSSKNLVMEFFFHQKIL